MTNVEAFDQLEAAIVSNGRPFARREIWGPPIGDPEEIVAQGLEKNVDTNIEHHGIFVAGRLSVRALVALEGIVDPFEAERNWHLDSPAKWLLRSRLTFTIPENPDIEAGEHAVIMSYVLAPNGPAVIDNYYTEEREHLARTDAYNNALTEACKIKQQETGDQYAGLNVEDQRRLGVPEYPGEYEGEMQGVHGQSWQVLPGQPNAFVMEGGNTQSRTTLVRKWLENDPEADGMAMLSATTLKIGGIQEDELPRTIAWLLN